MPERDPFLALHAQELAHSLADDAAADAAACAGGRSHPGSCAGLEALSASAGADADYAKSDGSANEGVQMMSVQGAVPELTRAVGAAGGDVLREQARAATCTRDLIRITNTIVLG